MKILYAGVLGANATSLHRFRALARLGHEVHGFDPDWALGAGGPLLSKIRYRTAFGPVVDALNRQVLAEALRLRPDLVWFDKAVFIQPSTLRALRQAGIFTVHYNIDNPFGPRRDPGWRLVKKAIPDYDLHLVQRDSNFADYRAAGARDVFMLRTAYEPSLHYPPPEGWSDADRPYDVVYIGAAHEERPRFLLELWERYGIRTRIWGCPRWSEALPPAARAELVQGTELWNDDYRETIWRARICLCFVTHGNADDVAHKSFEITACGTLLLAEDSPGHRAHFREDEEIVFFRSVEECAEKIRRYLPDEAARSRIAAAGARRAQESGYGNDARLAEVLLYIERTYFARSA